MPTSATSVILFRTISILVVVLAAFGLGVGSFPYKSVFVGLAFSHFFLGFYYSKRNAGLLREKKPALILATFILLGGLYFAVKLPRFAPYFLAVHTALSDGYLLQVKSRMKDAEHMRLLKTCFYLVCFTLLFLEAISGTMVGTLVLGGVGLALIGTIFYYTENKLSLGLFELPLVAAVVYTKSQSITLDPHFMGFYHIMTWYVFSFWMLFIKEKSVKKTASFFSTVGVLSVLFIVLFEQVLKLSITDLGFTRIIAFWSILHITSSVSLSNFNPRQVTEFFYVKRRQASEL